MKAPTLLLAALCALGLLAGCTAAPAESPVPSEPPTASSAPASTPETPDEPSSAPDEPSSALEASAPAEQPPAQSSTPASRPAPSIPAEPEPLYYLGERVESVYALDTDQYLGSLLTHEEVEELLPEFEAYVREGDALDERSFVIFTDGGRYYLDLNAAAPAALAAGWQAAYDHGPHYAQWFVHMTPGKLEKAVFSGLTSDCQYRADVTLTDRDQLDRLAAFLKTEYPIDGFVRAAEGANNPNTPSDLMILGLDFSTGVNYVCIGYTRGLSINASDLGWYVGYKTSVETNNTLRDFMYALRLEQGIPDETFPE